MIFPGFLNFALVVEMIYDLAQTGPGWNRTVQGFPRLFRYVLCPQLQDKGRNGSETLFRRFAGACDQESACGRKLPECCEEVAGGRVKVINGCGNFFNTGSVNPIRMGARRAPKLAGHWAWILERIKFWSAVTVAGFRTGLAGEASRRASPRFSIF